MQATSGTFALVYLSSMMDNVWTAVASLVVGETNTLPHRPWAKVAPERDGVTCTELTMRYVVFAEPWWGELVEP
jgi:hypothetical protein